LYSATAAAVVQSRLHEPCSVCNSALFYVRQTVSCIFVAPRTRSWQCHCLLGTQIHRWTITRKI